MSLVNEMLRDLEARRQREEAAALRTDVHAVDAPNGHRWRWPVALLIIVVAVAAGIYFGSFSGQRADADKTVETAVAIPDEKAAETADAADDRIENARLIGGLVSDKQDQTVGRPDVELRADSADPANGNANNIAHSDDEANRAIEQKEADKPANAEVPPSARNIATTTSSAGSPNAKEDPASAATAATSSTHKEKQATAKMANSGAASGMTKTRHQPTPAEKASKAYKAGADAVRVGDVEQAESQFRAALRADPTTYGAREALAALLSREGRTREAIELFVTGMQADPAHRNRFARLYARLLVADNRTEKAISVLEKHLPNAADAPRHYAFLAALQEQTDAHRAAVDNYRKALEAQPGNGRWWAGLAVAYEQSRTPNKALTAYRRARRTGGLGTTLATYVNQRIKALTP